MQNRINLFNYHQQEINYLKLRIYVLLCVVVLFAILFNLFMYLDIQYKIEQQKSNNTFWANQQQILNKQIEPIKEFKKRAANIENKIKLIKVIEGKGDNSIAIMHELYHLTPDRVYYTNMNINFVSGNITMKGVAASPLFVAQMLDYMRESSTALYNPKLKNNLTNDQNTYNFEIEAQIDKSKLKAEIESNGG
ncbi:MAG: hypothetical protein EKK64_11255 [Neisseriaceae bacterium]|nr:MAG: hypothetical protein EKK64_11255 [Neisseriaceae bacterium]